MAASIVVSVVGRSGFMQPVGVELVIHGCDLRHRWTVVVRHDCQSWRYDCSI
jgi:hypothetical protein